MRNTGEREPNGNAREPNISIGPAHWSD